MKAVKFHHYQTQVEMLSRVGLEDAELHMLASSNPDKFYAAMDKACDEFGMDVTTKVATVVEWKFLDCGRPYYKVFPGILHQMAHTSINVPVEQIRPPYPAFEIRFPRRDCGPLSDYYQSLIVGFASPRDDDGLIDLTAAPPGTKCGNQQPVKANLDDTYLSMNIFWAGTDIKTGKKEPGRFDYFCLDLAKGKTLEECFRDTKYWGDAYDTTDQHYHIMADHPDEVFPSLGWMLRAVLCTTMFGIARHELVMPDIPIPVINATRRGRIGKQLEEHRRLKQKFRGWLVGSEISLPQPLVVYNRDCRTGAGQELKYGHIRSGHLRMQPCGPGGKERKLIFVPPTVVRPDLPVRTTHGYRIGDA